MAKRARNGLNAMAENRTIWAAWSRVAAGSNAPGVDGVTTERFASRLDHHLENLRSHLRAGTYQPQPLRPMTVKRNGKLRPLGLPTVRDRVVQRCFLEVFDRELDATNAEICFAYRRGRSWLDALAKVERYRELGLRWVFRGDITSFFEEIQHPQLEERLLAALPRDRPCIDLAMRWIAAPLLSDNGLQPRTKGVPQGAPVSPALANLYLTAFDRAIQDRRGGVVRYADDMVVCCADPDAAESARFDIEQALRPLGLTMNTAKSYVSSFDVGFSFLGWVFFRDDGFEEGPHDGWVHPMSVARARAQQPGQPPPNVLGPESRPAARSKGRRPGQGRPR